MSNVVGPYLNYTTNQTGDGTSPFSSPLSWDTITIGGMQWWGKFEIRRAKRKYKWDVKDASGQEGATETYRGRRPETFTIRFYIWTDLMWLNWKILSGANFVYDGVKEQPKPIDIQHPGLNATGITQVICEALPIVEKVSDDLMFAADVELREYFPPIPKDATATPAGAKNVSGDTAVTPGLVPSNSIAAKQAVIKQLQNQISNVGTPGGLP